jgi:hypothetical protein
MLEDLKQVQSTYTLVKNLNLSSFSDNNEASGKPVLAYNVISGELVYYFSSATNKVSESLSIKWATL